MTVSESRYRRDSSVIAANLNAITEHYLDCGSLHRTARAFGVTDYVLTRYWEDHNLPLVSGGKMRAEANRRREAMVNRHKQGVSHKRIAVEFGVSPARVGQILARARRD